MKTNAHHSHEVELIVVEWQSVKEVAMDPSESSAYLLEHAQGRLHVRDIKAHYIASLPLLGCFDGPQTATTAKVEDGWRRGIEVVQSQALAAVGNEHMVPVIEVDDIVGILVRCKGLFAVVHGGDILARVHKVGVDHGGESKGIEQAR